MKFERLPFRIPWLILMVGLFSYGDLRGQPADEAIFGRAFSSPQIYQRNDCEGNANRLLKAFVGAGIPISSARVIYLWGPSGMPVSRPRHPFAEWGYHVIVEKERRIFDLDFTTSPVVLSVQRYFSQNIIPTDLQSNPTSLQRLLQSYRAVVVPGADFLKHYPSSAVGTGLSNFRKWIQDNYPPKTLEELLRKL